MTTTVRYGRRRVPLRTPSAAASSAKPHLIGIAGPSCAGKSELAHRLAAILAGPVISLDSYYRDLAHLPPAERAHTNFDEPAAIDEELLTLHLRLLAQGAEVEIPVYDFTRHVRSAQVRRIRAVSFGLVEGLFTLHWEGVRSLFGTTIFVDAPEDVCLQRRLDRDLRERGRTRESVLEQYERTVRPMGRLYVLPQRAAADLVVDGTAPLEDSVAAVMARLGIR